MDEQMEDVASATETQPTGTTIPGPEDTIFPDEETGPQALEVDIPWETQSSIAGDSALGEDSYTVTTSVTSSIKDFRHEGGRRYHAFDEDAYYLPNDEVEAGRLDLQHYNWKLTFDGALSWVREEGLERVLDVGTGTGIWAMEYAEQHPEALVFGTDLSPIQPDFVPPNCQFIVDNAEYDWVFDTKFNYIHSRLLTLGIKDWRRYFKQCWDNLAPGGWIETGETQFPQKRADHEPLQDSPLIIWSTAVVSAAANAGLDLAASEHFTQYLEELGFVNIERVNIQWPIRSWAKGRKNKLIGRVMRDNTLKAIPAIGGLLLARYAGWTKEQIEESERACAEDIEKGHFYSPMVCHRAQKPWDAAS